MSGSRGFKAVSQDGFFYDGAKFYTQVSCGSRKQKIERADADYLYSLLTPPDSSRKDRNITFYRGQLKHYGVQASSLKTKKAVKQRLLAAFENAEKTLEVPIHIRRIEAQLREQYEPVWEVGKLKITSSIE